MSTWTPEKSDANYRRCRALIAISLALTALNVISIGLRVLGVLP